MKRLGLVLLMSALAIGCQDRQPITAPPGGLSADIWDGAHGQSGNADFFFLPPLVGNPVSNPNFDAGKFDPGLRPVVQVFRLPGGLDVCTGTSVHGPVVAPVEAGSEQYKVDWNTRASNLVPGVTYRICVFSSMFGSRMGKLLGYLDVAPIDGGMRNARTGETYAFQDDRTLPVKFRIEKGALCAAGVLECAAAAGVVAAGDTVVLPSKLAAVVIPDGAVGSNDTVTIVIAQQPPPDTSSGGTPQCLPGDLVQSRGCYHFSTEPANYHFASDVRLEVCVNIDSLTPNEVSRLELYKYSGTGTPQMLPRADTTEIDCSSLVVGAAGRSAPTSLAGAVWRGAQRFLADLLSPAALHAAPMATTPKGLGGLAGSFSDVGGAVPPATKLTFTVEPADDTAGTVLAPAIKVAVQDALDRTVAGSTDTITLAITSGTGTTGAVLGGTFIQVAVNGVATFANLTIDKAGSGYTLSATSALSVPLNGDTSTAFTVTAGPVSTSHSVVSVWQPVVASGGVDTLILQAKDALGNNLTTGGLAVVFTASGGTSTGTIGPTNDWGSGRYTATFTGDTAGTATTIQAVIGGVLVTSALPTVTVTPGAVSPAHSVVSVSQPTDSAGTPVTLTLQAKDASGNNLISGGSTVVFTASGGTSTGTIAPSPATDNGNGTYAATFTGVVAGTATTIQAAIGGVLVTTTLPTVQVVPGAPAKLSFTVEPTTTMVRDTIKPAVQVAIQDVHGNIVTSATNSVSMSSPWGGLFGDTIVAAVNGVAAFSALRLLYGGNQTLLAHAVDLDADTSATFNVIAFRSLSTGFNHTCGIANDSTAYCWGLNSSGQLGNGTTTNSSTPVAVSGGLKFDFVSAGHNHTCGKSGNSSTYYCWGDNSGSQLGTGDTTGSSTPVAVVSGGLYFQQMSAGERHTCGLSGSGTVYCWGDNFFGELGNGTQPTPSSSPVPVTTPLGVTFQWLSAEGQGTGCAVTSGGASYYCWGSNGFGQYGNGTLTGLDTAVLVSPPAGFQTLVAGYWHTCGLTGGGAAYCWGSNNQGQAGRDPGAAFYLTSPWPISGFTFASLTAGGQGHSCGVASGSGFAYCWGKNAQGELGDSSTTASYTPQLVHAPAGVTFSTVDAGSDHTCGLASGGTVYCWGSNAYGQLGDSTTANRSKPVLLHKP